MGNPPPAQTIMVLENFYERRVYHSMDGAAKGLGWGNANSELLIYRLDDKATAAANRDLKHLIPDLGGNPNGPFKKYVTSKGIDWKAHKADAIAIMKRWWR